MKHNLAMLAPVEAAPKRWRLSLKERRAARRQERLKARQAAGDTPKIDVAEAVARTVGRIAAEGGLCGIEFAGDADGIRVKGSAAYAVAPVAPMATVTSPMVGIVARAPQKGLRIGDPVKQGQNVLVLEMLGVLHLVPAPRAGVLAEILVAEGQAVEYGEPLFAIR